MNHPLPVAFKAGFSETVAATNECHQSRTRTMRYFMQNCPDSKNAKCPHFRLSAGRVVPPRGWRQRLPIQPDKLGAAGRHPPAAAVALGVVVLPCARDSGDVANRRFLQDESLARGRLDWEVGDTTIGK